MKRLRRDERGDAAVIGCIGLAFFFLLLGGAAIDLWGTMSADRNLAAIAQDAAAAGASGLDVTAYRAGQVELDPTTATNLALANLQAQPDLPHLSGPPQITVSGADITVTLTEDVSSLVLEIAHHHAIPITVSATSAARPSAGP